MRVVAPFGLCFALSKYFHRTGPEQFSLMLDGEDRTTADHFTYFSTFFIRAGSSVVKMSVHIYEYRAKYTGLKQLWSRPDILLKLKVHVHCVAVDSSALRNMELARRRFSPLVIMSERYH